MATLLVESIRDLDRAGLQPYRTLRRRKDLERLARFVVEGDKVVMRLLESPFPVESLLVTEAWLDRLGPLLERREDRIQVFLARKEDIEAITGYSCYQGVKAVGRIERPATLDGVLRESGRPRLLAALEGISNAENMGVIVRNAAALGVQALIVGETSCSPFLTRAIRTSMGAVFRLPVVEDVALVEALGRVRAAGVWCVAAHPSPSARTFESVDLRGDCCVVLGSEGYGLSPEALGAVDMVAGVPMALGVDSLNVSSAAAVCFYEAARQRGFPTTRVEPPSGAAGRVATDGGASG